MKVGCDSGPLPYSLIFNHELLQKGTGTAEHLTLLRLLRLLFLIWGFLLASSRHQHATNTIALHSIPYRAFSVNSHISPSVPLILLFY